MQASDIVNPPFIPTIEDSIKPKTKKLLSPYLHSENKFADTHIQDVLKQDIVKEFKLSVPALEQSHYSFENAFVYYWRQEYEEEYKKYFRCKKEEFLNLVRQAKGLPNDVIPTIEDSLGVEIPSEKEELLFDGNMESKGKKFFDLGWLDMSPDESIISYGVDYNGDEVYEIFIKYIGLNSDKSEYKLIDQFIIEGKSDEDDDEDDDEDGEDDDEEDGEDEEDDEDDDEEGDNEQDEEKKSDEKTNFGISSEFEWYENNTSYLYTTLDETLRSYRVYQHTLGEPHEQDRLLFEEKDNTFSVSIGSSVTERKLYIICVSTDSSEVWWIDSHNPAMDPQCLVPRKPGVEYFAEYLKDSDEFLISTNEGGCKNFRVITCPASNPALSGPHVTEIVPHSREIYIEEFIPFRDFIAIQCRKDGVLKCLIHDRKSNEQHFVQLPENSCDFYFSDDNKFDSNTLRLIYSSPIRPVTVFDYSIDLRSLISIKEQQVVNFNPEHYKVESLLVRSRDEITDIPVTLIYKVGDLTTPIREQNRPTFLTAYGAYGISDDCNFQPHALPVLNRGIIYAIAHVRGGGEKGREWWENGMLLKKKNTFYDFIDIATYLINEGYTSRDKLCCYGASAGGLTIGASINMAPHLFKAAILDVPFVNTLNTMKNPDIPLTTLEYSEWGNPANEEFERYIASYSPIDNIDSLVKSDIAPDLLILSGLNDPRVSYVEPTAYCCQLREAFAAKGHSPLILLKTNMKAGHCGSSGRFEKLDEWAYTWTFVFQEIL